MLAVLLALGKQIRALQSASRIMGRCASQSHLLVPALHSTDLLPFSWLRPCLPGRPQMSNSCAAVLLPAPGQSAPPHLLVVAGSFWPSCRTPSQTRCWWPSVPG